MKPVRGSWLERRFVPMVRKYAVRNPCCFPPGPGEISAVLGKLEALNHAGGEPRASVGTIVRMEDLLSGEQAAGRTKIASGDWRRFSQTRVCKYPHRKERWT